MLSSSFLYIFLLYRMIESERRGLSQRLFHLSLHSANTYSVTTISQVVHASTYPPRGVGGMVTMHNSESLVRGRRWKAEALMGDKSCKERRFYVTGWHVSSFLLARRAPEHNQVSDSTLGGFVCHLTSHRIVLWVGLSSQLHQ